MKIIKNIEEATVKFENLKVGDVFLDREEKVCMKVPEIYDRFYQQEMTAYDLENNEFFWLDNGDEVRPLKAHMEVK